MWLQLTMVHGRPRHPQSQGSVERANGDTKDMLISWMSDNNSQDWVVGISGVARVLKAPVQRHAMGPLVTKQLSNYSFAARTAATRPVDRVWP